MKRLNKMEFEDRIMALARARKIFIPHITKNISVAFALYQEVFATRERELFITSMRDWKSTSILDAYKRPTCPKCGASLFLRLIREPLGPRNRKGWKSCWECYKDNCTYEEYSKRSLRMHMRRLRRKKNA